MRTFRELVIEKKLRYRKDHIRSRPPVTSDATWTSYCPSRTGTSSATGSNGTAGSRRFICFASHTMDNKHTNATYLKDKGVWLGDYDEEDMVVTSLSFNRVIKRYDESTDGGLLSHPSDGPHVNAQHTLEKDKKKMWCAACRAVGRSPTSDVVAENVEFIHQSDDDTHVADPMYRTVSTVANDRADVGSDFLQVWIFPCSLGERKVFALLKCEKARFDATYLWSFWKVDGSYTDDIFLTTVPKQNAEGITAAVPVDREKYVTSLHPIG